MDAEIPSKDNNDRILTIVKSIISEILNIPTKEIFHNTNLVEDIHAYSLDIVDISIRLEEEFNIQIPDESLSAITTVDDIVAYLSNISGMR